MIWDMSMLATTKTVRVHNRPVYFYEDWDGHTKAMTERVQTLVKTFYIFCLPIWWVKVDEEVVPDHVLTALGCFGDCVGWKSKFKEYIK